MAQTHFDEQAAARYETYWPEPFQPAAIDPVVNFLAGLAGDGGALKLSVGTGRLALPLSSRGTLAMPLVCALEVVVLLDVVLNGGIWIDVNPGTGEAAATLLIDGFPGDPGGTMRFICS